MRDSEQLFLARTLSWVALIATLAITPWYSVDPINVPKLVVISLGGFICLTVAATHWKVIFARDLRVSILAVLLFVLDLLVVLLLAGNNFSQEFYGTFGRSTGFVAYLSLAGLLIAGIISASRFALSRFSWFLIASGALSMFYGVLQSQGLDPVNWSKGLNPVIGFVGNPDFQSALIGFCGIMAFAILIRERSARIKAGLSIYLTLAFYVIYQTQAQQGFIVYFGGIAIVIFLFLVKSKAKKFSLPVLGAGFVGIFLVATGALNKGPLASILHKDSVIYRGDYWRAGLKMTFGHPIFGVGLDCYGDWYRRSRTLEATLRRGPEIVSNSAHNVLLDISSGGGFPLLAFYFVIMLMVLRAAIRVTRRNLNFDPYFSGLFAVWVAYQAQSIISINELGLAVWGWVISGLIIGWEIKGRSPEMEIEVTKPNSPKRSGRTKNVQGLLPSTSLAIFVGLLIGSLVGLPSFLASGKFKSALASGSASVIVNSAYSFPQDGYRSVQIAYVLHRNKLDSQALPVILDASKKFPDIFDVWKVLASLSNVTPDQMSEAKAQMKRLDPHNPDLK